MIENISPVIMHKRELRADSEGAGRRRGGFGQEMEIGVRGNSSWTLSAMYDRTKCPALGLRGGSSGGLGAVRTASREPLHPKRQQRLEGSERVILSLPGGGGFGSATEREPEMVSRDVTDGLVSIERARTSTRLSSKGIAAVTTPSMRTRLPVCAQRPYPVRMTARDRDMGLM